MNGYELRHNLVSKLNECNDRCRWACPFDNKMNGERLGYELAIKVIDAHLSPSGYMSARAVDKELYLHFIRSFSRGHAKTGNWEFFSAKCVALNWVRDNLR